MLSTLPPTGYRKPAVYHYGLEVSIVTPQRSGISLVLRLIIMDGILRILVRSGVKVVIYVDNFVIFLLGMFPFAISETMKAAFGKLC